MNTNHRIRPKNQLEAKQIAALELATEILEEHLGVQVTLQAQRQAGWAGADAWHAGKYCHDEQLIKINFRNLEGVSTLQVLTVLGHEFRHVVQHQTGLLVEQRWTGEEQTPSFFHPNAKYSAYFNLPQEVDARAHQDAYADLVIKDPRFKDFVTALDIDGIVQLKKDLEATYKSIGFEYPDEHVMLFRDHDEQVYWLSTEQIGIKKWSRKYANHAFEHHIELLKSQPVKLVMTPVTVFDLVS